MTVRDLRQELANILVAETESRRMLLALIRWLDVRISEIEEGTRQERFLWRVMARATIAAGATVEVATPAVKATLEAARDLDDAPGEDLWDRLCRAATNSYPLGPGDGCHAVKELGEPGMVGTGDYSGSGFLWSASGDSELQVDQLARALRAELAILTIARPDLRG